MKPARPQRRFSVGALVYGVVLATLVGVAAELTARVQDWVRYGTAITAAPDRDVELFIDSAAGRQGRPNGQYKKWRLNEFGFRGGPITIKAAPEVTRVVILGSSEAFGLYESPAHEFPAQLAALLGNGGPYEVVNTAMVGLTLRTSVRYWQNWISQFRPQIVVIYPSPLFYLNDSIAPRPAETHKAAVGPAPIPSPSARRQFNLSGLLGASRMLEHARDKWDFPDVIQRQRDARAIQDAVRAHPAGWVFTEVPAERVQIFISDLSALVTTIQESGAQPIVLTHAASVLDPPSKEDAPLLAAARVNSPRAMPDVIGRFLTLTNEAIRSWTRDHGVPLVDVAAAMNGHDEWFGDLIHFSDAGAAVIAHLVADQIQHPHAVQ